jgi:hypothetical protein
VYACACVKAIRSARDERSRVFASSYSSRGFCSHRRPDNLAYQSNIFDGCASLGNAKLPGFTAQLLNFGACRPGFEKRVINHVRQSCVEADSLGIMRRTIAHVLPSAVFSASGPQKFIR